MPGGVTGPLAGVGEGGGHGHYGSVVGNVDVALGDASARDAADGLCDFKLVGSGETVNGRGPLGLTETERFRTQCAQLLEYELAGVVVGGSPAFPTITVSALLSGAIKVRAN